MCLLWLGCPLNLKWKRYRFLLAAFLTLQETLWPPGQSPERFLSICLQGDTFWAPCPCSNLLLTWVESYVCLGQSWLIILLPLSKFTWILRTQQLCTLHVCMQGRSVKAMRDGGKGIWSLTPRIKAEQFKCFLVATLQETHWGTLSLGFPICQAGILLHSPISLQADCEVQLQWDGTCQSIILPPPKKDGYCYY